MDKAVIVPIADGSEELEAVCIIDVLRRAGARVTVASVGGLRIVGSKGVQILADRLVAECVNDVFDLVVLPGGMPGSEYLRNSSAVVHLLRTQAEEKRLFAAICSAPAVVLDHHHLVDGRRIACHPGFRERVMNAVVTDDPVVVDGEVVTGCGAGVAVEFSLTLVDLLYGREKARETADGMVFSGTWR